MTKAKHLFPIILLLLTLTFNCPAQQINDKIDYIALKFTHSLRIANHSIVIELLKRPDGVVVIVKSKPIYDYESLRYTVIDTAYSMSHGMFNDLSTKAQNLYRINLSKALGSGYDGTECAIEFGTYRSKVSYQFWSLDYKTKKRDLTTFLDICKSMLKIGGFKPKRIL